MESLEGRDGVALPDEAMRSLSASDEIGLDAQEVSARLRDDLAAVQQVVHGHMASDTERSLSWRWPAQLLLLR